MISVGPPLRRNDIIRDDGLLGKRPLRISWKRRLDAVGTGGAATQGVPQADAHDDPEPRERDDPQRLSPPEVCKLHTWKRGFVPHSRPSEGTPRPVRLQAYAQRRRADSNRRVTALQALQRAERQAMQGRCQPSAYIDSPRQDLASAHLHPAVPRAAGRTAQSLPTPLRLWQTASSPANGQGGECPAGPASGVMR